MNVGEMMTRVRAAREVIHRHDADEFSVRVHDRNPTNLVFLHQRLDGIEALALAHRHDPVRGRARDEHVP